MKILHKISLLALSLSLLTMSLSSCQKLIYDDLTECPQGIQVSLYTQSPCAVSPAYPAMVKETKIFAFDEKGTLLGAFDANGITLDDKYSQKIDYLHVGSTTFYAWGSSDLSRYDFSQFVVGKTKKEEMILSLKLQATQQATADMPILFASRPTVLKQQDRRMLGTHYDNVSINLQQITNALNLTIHGLYPNHDYQALIISANDKYHMDGTIAKSDAVEFTTTTNKFEKGVLSAHFDLLKLEDNPSARLVIKDMINGNDVFDESLIKIITKADNVNLACEHTFDVTLKVENFILVTGIINQWNVVYRDLDLAGN